MYAWHTHLRLALRKTQTEVDEFAIIVDPNYEMKNINGRLIILFHAVGRYGRR